MYERLLPSSFPYTEGKGQGDQYILNNIVTHLFAICARANGFALFQELCCISPNYCKAQFTHGANGWMSHSFSEQSIKRNLILLLFNSPSKSFQSTMNSMIMHTPYIRIYILSFFFFFSSK